MRYAYYSGCTLHATAREFDLSTRAVCSRLGIELEEIPDWNCCGATAAHATSHLLSVALAARNLALAETQEADLLVPCAACYHRLVTARKEMSENPHLRERVVRIIGREYRGRIGVRSLLEVLDHLDPERLAAGVVRPLRGLKVACYYGCLLVRPPAVTGFDDPEQPQVMDRLMRQWGAEPVDWGYKTECCGAGQGFSNEPVVLKLVRDILATASRAGADCLVCACTLCQSNLDARQGHVNRVYGSDFRLPVMYFTQLIGVGMGMEARELGLDSLFVDPRPVIRALG
ncbi:MAG: CoB--CoM heterodisulfide reductase iron-sulfur subunit B family protein [Candidatus Desulforudis sp.]|nr:CoB--CoM heterodisulfide reductase iron-sulfur subunit B family protein [Desulforudis sp.]